MKGNSSKAKDNKHSSRIKRLTSTESLWETSGIYDAKSISRGWVYPVIIEQVTPNT